MDDKSREDLEQRMDELARKYAETHDPLANAEVEAISRRLAAYGADRTEPYRRVALMVDIEGCQACRHSGLATDKV
jgi:hypothetical protein